MPDLTAPEGFKIAAAAAGIRKSGLDLGLLYSDRPATTAAVFTRNAFPAAPILVTRQHLKVSGNTSRAVLVNAGNANAVTGEAGMNAARQCAAELAKHLGCKPSDVFISSTGVIGRPLPVEKISAAIPSLVREMNPGGTDSFSRAIMTTDTVPKVATSRVDGVRMLGFAKGSGMIHPNMATMLSYILTDAKIEFAALDKALRYAVDLSFHSITVDGDTSTNDTVAVLANGASGISPSPEAFTAQLTEVCQTLAKAIARDGEGATKFVELTIEGAPSDEAAREIGRTIARSPLVKTAIYGCDPNWGRLICAVGNSGIPLSGEEVELFIDDVPLINGDLKVASEKLKSKEVKIRVSLHSGSGKATVWTCDLTEEYIHINADYTT
ncbi:MAG TPA: bifunctional glutamate N-acetyltransferase/amino-acid acetyltransferase ArgJ [Terriglobia bacterium]|nr:bifunctional glutamate N-acetyltransferase/amino-acid acetyltransferase ArgJ [Terriglobia bacterium]